MHTWTCHCCGARFWSDKPQDRNRDLGFGTCDKCRKTMYSPERLAKTCNECHGICPTGSLCAACTGWCPSPHLA